FDTRFIGYGGTGIYNLSGTGVLTPGYQYVGLLGGTGTFNQTGGTNTLAGTLTIAAANPGSSGTYTLSGTGSLTATNLTINAGGQFHYDGGTLSPTNLTITGGLAAMAVNGNRVL